MHLQLALLALIPTILAMPNAAPVSEPFEPNSLQARSCSSTTGCVSEAGASAGKYCGFCTQVRGTYDVDDIYQCACLSQFYFTDLNSGRLCYLMKECCTDDLEGKRWQRIVFLLQLRKKQRVRCRMAESEPKVGIHDLLST